MIARDYDAYFADNRLFHFDRQVVLECLRGHISSGSTVADLGCGTGRMLMALGECGYRGIAVDLSTRMLEIVRDKAAERAYSIDCVRSNLVELDGLRDDAVDAAVCLFSTLGMIRGRGHRRRALEHVRRILKPGGPFVLHVHNYWYNLYDPGGPWWVAKGYLRSLCSRDFEAGDKFFAYRGVPNMFLHVFTHGEIRRELSCSGFRVKRMIPLDPRRHRALRCPGLLGRLRANGWIIAAV